MDIQIITNRLGIVENLIGEIKFHNQVFGPSLQFRTVGKGKLSDSMKSYLSRIARQAAAICDSLKKDVCYMAGRTNSYMRDLSHDHGNMALANASLLVDFSYIGSSVAAVCAKRDVSDNMSHLGASALLKLMLNILSLHETVVGQLIGDIASGNYFSDDTQVRPISSLVDSQGLGLNVVLQKIHILRSLVTVLSSHGEFINELPYSFRNSFSSLVVVSMVGAIYQYVSIFQIRRGDLIEEILTEINYLYNQGVDYEERNLFDTL